MVLPGPCYTSGNAAGKTATFVATLFGISLPFLFAHILANAFPSGPLLDNSQRIRFAQVSQCIRGAFALGVFFSYGLQHQLLRRLQLGEGIPPGAAAANDWRVRVLSGIQLVIVLMAFVAFVQWFYRAYGNAHRLPRAKPAYSPSIAVWCWFIPVINLWYPYRIMVEIGHYFGRFSHLRQTVLSSRWDYLVTAWWSLSIAIVLFSRFTAFRAMGGAQSLDDLLHTTRVLMGTQVLTLLSALVTLAMLKVIAPHERDSLVNQADSMATAQAASTTI